MTKVVGLEVGGFLSVGQCCVCVSSETRKPSKTEAGTCNFVIVG